AIDMDAVRKNQHPFAERFDHVAIRIEMENGRDVLDFVGCRIQAAVRAAALGDPDRAAVLVDFDGARRSPLPAGRLKKPVIVSYGFGRSFTGAPGAGWSARICASPMAKSAAAANASTTRVRACINILLGSVARSRRAVFTARRNY